MATYEHTEQNNDGTLILQNNGKSYHLEISNVFFFYRTGKQITIITLNNEEHTIKDSLDALEKRFYNRGFMRINRSAIFNFDIVVGYEWGEKRNTLDLILKKKYRNKLREYGEDRFTVTNEYIPNILSRFP